MSASSQSLLPLALGAVLLAGCAEELPPIDRVQPDYFEKKFFVGENFTDVSDDPEFYSQGTLIDVGYGASQDGLFTSTYAQPLTRVKWTITEDFLIARLAYERINSSDGKGVGKATNDGIVVAAYPILKHFDIQRTYNPSTGEQLNVIEENTVDRPWYEREYIRVDWSRNHSTDNYDFDTLSMLGIYGGVTYEPLTYYVNDPTHEDAPHFVPEDGYLDITNKAFAKPQLVDISHLGWGLGVVPACWFDPDFMNGNAPAATCSPVELTIRQSFRRVPEKNDYEPAHWDGYRFQAFGAFVTERRGYARNYGMTDTQWHRFINRYNIWERSHYYAKPDTMEHPVPCYTPETTPVGKDPHRDENRDGTEDECAGVGRGSRCDEFSQMCTLPYRDRKPVTQAWYFTNGSNLEYFEPTRDAAHEWDVALRSAVMTARYSECVRVAGTDTEKIAQCADQHPVYFGGQEENEDAVALAREVDDCRAGRAWAGQDCEKLADILGRQRGYSPGVIELAKMQEMVVLCHSPVQWDDPEACGPKTSEARLEPGVTAASCAAARANGERDTALARDCATAINVRRGDLRYHQVNAITTPQTPSPWGIMVDSNDPLTGETIAASINVWTHVNDLWSQGIVDTARYIKGELTTADVTEGTYVHDWAAAAEAATRGGTLPTLTRAEVLERVAAFSRVDPETLKGASGDLDVINPTLKQQAARIALELQGIRADARAPTLSRPIYEARRNRAIGTPTEAQLTTPMMQSYAGVDGIPNSEVIMNYASPLRAANPSVQRDLMNMKELAIAEQGACVMHEAPAPFAIADLSDLLESKFGAFNPDDLPWVQAERAEKMRRYLARKAHYAVIAHEMGHSIGLRHNFVSSSDAFNYRPQYWQLRTENGQVTEPCTDLRPDGSCVGPRYFDPVTENERKNLITMFMQSSTMDYAGEALQDLIGLGAYDFAAARMFYGDTAAVFFEDSYKRGTPRGVGVLAKQDNFGGIVGIQPSIGTGTGNATIDIHYSELNNHYELITNCREVDPEVFRPAAWDTGTMGEWHPLLDGLIVQVDGKYSRCQSQQLDYVQWNSLRDPTTADVGFVRAGHAIDPLDRVRFPYGFATDRWADLGNLSVYRHDNGADPYELFDFLITQQEVNHIFDNYRRNRSTFSVRGASNRTLYRYNTKMRDGAKGLGLIANIYRDFAADMGYDYETLWPFIANEFYAPNILASSIAFDHFARQLARPETGPHYLAPATPVNSTPVLRSATDAPGNGGTTVVVVPNGATGLFRNVVPGGRPIENALASDQGEYDSEFTINAGSYYDKAWTAMIMTESVDNFISDSRRDFTDARYRAVSLADLFPDAYRRWIANNLTGDEEIKGTRIAVDTNGRPITEVDGYPVHGIGWTTWTTTTPETCFVGQDNLLCNPSPGNTVPLESQVGWEQQKFLIAFTLQYLPENQQQTWLNQLNLWEIGADTDPGFGNRIEFHSPTGRIYVAKTFGTETLFGKRVQKGIAARMLEYANQLLEAAYVVDPGPDPDGDGNPDWFIPRLVNGQPRVKFDPGMQFIGPGGVFVPNPTCNATENSGCTCSANRACIELQKYESVPVFLRQAMRDYGLADPSMKGLYD